MKRLTHNIILDKHRNGHVLIMVSVYVIISGVRQFKRYISHSLHTIYLNMLGITRRCTYRLGNNETLYLTSWE